VQDGQHQSADGLAVQHGIAKDLFPARFRRDQRLRFLGTGICHADVRFRLQLDRLQSALFEAHIAGQAAAEDREIGGVAEGLEAVVHPHVDLADHFVRLAAALRRGGVEILHADGPALPDALVVEELIGVLIALSGRGDGAGIIDLVRFAHKILSLKRNSANHYTAKKPSGKPEGNFDFVSKPPGRFTS